MTFELLETLRWTKEEGFFLLERHLTRLEQSARHFGFRCAAAEVTDALERAVSAADRPQRVRLLLGQSGSVRIEARPLELPESPARIALAAAPIDPHDEFLFHKTTNRAMYDRARLPGVDDVVLWNPLREITETTIANLVVDVGGRKRTPPVSCGLLPGTYRAQLLDEGAIETAIVTIDDLHAAAGVWLINSVRGWWKGELVKPS